MWLSKLMNEPEDPLNPYVIGSAVSNGPAFVGREDVLQDVRNVLQHSQQNAIVLYGQRRIGKTSILKELEAKLAQAGYLPIFFDLQDKGKLPLDQVNQELADKISDKLNSPSQLALDDILFHWQSPQKLVILFDEFEAVAGNEFEERQASETFFPYWRDILVKVDKAKLNFVFTIGRKVEDLNEKAMSLLKEVPSKKVSLLDETQTKKLIKLSESDTNKTLKWNENTIQAVWEQTGGHPFITQILCYCIWNHLYETNPRRKPPIVRVANVNDNLANALETGGNAFQWLWDGLPATEKLVTSLLSNQNKPITTQVLEQLLKDHGLRIANEEQQQATRILRQWDVIKPDRGEKFRFCVELFRRWIAKEKPLPKVQQELDSSESHAHNFYDLGRRFRSVNQLKDAVDNLEKAVKLNPNHVSANGLLTETYLDQKNWEPAWKKAKAFSLLRPKLARPLLSQALEKLIIDQNEDTQLRYYEETLKIDSEHVEVKQKWQQIWQQRGENAYRNGNLEKALEAFQKIGLTEKVIEIQNRLTQEINQTQRIIEAFLIEQIQETTTLDGIFLYEPQEKNLYLGTRNGIDVTQKSVIANSLFGSNQNQTGISILGLREIIERIKEEKNSREFEGAFFQFATSILSIYLIPNPKIFSEDCGKKHEDNFMIIGIISANNVIGTFIKESKKVVTRLKETLPIHIESNKIG